MKIFMRGGNSAALFLEEDLEENIVYLKGIDSGGKEWTIAMFSENGLRVYSGIDDDANWPTDELGRIKMDTAI